MRTVGKFAVCLTVSAAILVVFGTGYLLACGEPDYPAEDDFVVIERPAPGYHNLYYYVDLKHQLCFARTAGGPTLTSCACTTALVETANRRLGKGKKP